MSRRGAPRGKPVPPLALILLASFVALPFVLYFVPARWWYGEFGPPPRVVVEMLAPGVTADAPPTVGMRLEPSGFGTVTDAPRVLAERAPPGSMIGQTSGDTIAPDVARFLRGVPRERWENVPEKRITVCTLEGPPSYSGRIVLIDGCLRFQDARSDRPGPLVLGIPSVHRDRAGYLAVGMRNGGEEYEMRVGEPEGVFLAVGCSKDQPIQAPPDVARACGVDTMRRLQTIKRRPICSAEDRAQIEQYRRESGLTAELNEAAKHACREQRTPERLCPPPMPPIPPPPNLSDCRIEPPQSSQGSSTQP